MGLVLGVSIIYHFLIENIIAHFLQPAEDEADDDNANMVYGLLSILEVNIVKVSCKSFSYTIHRKGLH